MLKRIFSNKEQFLFKFPTDNAIEKANSHTNHSDKAQLQKTIEKICSYHSHKFDDNFYNKIHTLEKSAPIIIDRLFNDLLEKEYDYRTFSLIINEIISDADSLENLNKRIDQLLLIQYTDIINSLEIFDNINEKDEIEHRISHFKELCSNLRGGDNNLFFTNDNLCTLSQHFSQILIYQNNKKLNYQQKTHLIYIFASLYTHDNQCLEGKLNRIIMLNETLEIFFNAPPFNIAISSKIYGTLEDDIVKGRNDLSKQINSQHFRTNFSNFLKKHNLYNITHVDKHQLMHNETNLMIYYSIMVNFGSPEQLFALLTDQPDINIAIKPSYQEEKIKSCEEILKLHINQVCDKINNYGSPEFNKQFFENLEYWIVTYLKFFKLAQKTEVEFTAQNIAIFHKDIDGTYYLMKNNNLMYNLPENILLFVEKDSPLPWQNIDKRSTKVVKKPTAPPPDQLKVATSLPENQKGSDEASKGPEEKDSAEGKQNKDGIIYLVKYDYKKRAFIASNIKKAFDVSINNEKPSTHLISLHKIPAKVAFFNIAFNEINNNKYICDLTDEEMNQSAFEVYMARAEIGNISSISTKSFQIKKINDVFNLMNYKLTHQNATFKITALDTLPFDALTNISNFLIYIYEMIDGTTYTDRYYFTERTYDPDNVKLMTLFHSPDKFKKFINTLMAYNHRSNIDFLMIFAKHIATIDYNNNINVTEQFKRLDHIYQFITNKMNNNQPEVSKVIIYLLINGNEFRNNELFILNYLILGIYNCIPTMNDQSKTINDHFIRLATTLYSNHEEKYNRYDAFVHNRNIPYPKKITTYFLHYLIKEKLIDDIDPSIYNPLRTDIYYALKTLISKYGNTIDKDPHRLIDTTFKKIIFFMMLISLMAYILSMFLFATVLLQLAFTLIVINTLENFCFKKNYLTVNNDKIQLSQADFTFFNDKKYTLDKECFIDENKYELFPSGERF